jgi:lysyl endopeptidase
VAGQLHCEAVAYCGADAEPDGVHYLRVAWSRGATEAGSSGSGLFLADGRLVGMLSGGFSGCGEAEGVDDYRWVGVASESGG